MVLLRCLTDFSFISAEFEMLYLAAGAGAGMH